MSSILDWSEEQRRVDDLGLYIRGRIVVSVDKRAPFVVQYTRNMNRRPTWSSFSVARRGGTIGLSNHTRLFTEIDTIIQNQFREVGIL